VPGAGYDRTSRSPESLGIEMITVPMREDGTDVDLILLRLLILCNRACRGWWWDRCRVTDGTAARADHGQEHSAAIVLLIMIGLS
jgi:hypothetical protein